ncbi:hypothetical protein [Methanobrevibacter sp.]|uniref:hypothetical protein n=1 Tax=Methanobrevibacter sp. TaxID=66852 RepID=UPI0026104867|nr:hypothetical protein [uncultured Methanobrevibacter sp.]
MKSKIKNLFKILLLWWILIIVITSILFIKNFDINCFTPLIGLFVATICFIVNCQILGEL